MPPTTPQTFISLVAHFLDFLTVAIHTILYERQIYPHESFISARKYNYPVRQSRHPEVCEWINDAINALEVELLKGTVDRVAVVIFSMYDQPMERFMFDLSKFPFVPKKDWHVPFASNDSKDESRIPVVNMEEQFRAVMSKLAFCHRSLLPLPQDCTFTLAIELKDEADAPIGHPQPWIPVQPSLQKETARGESKAKSGEDLGGVRTTTIRTVDAGEMVFEMWIEEGRTKVDSLDRDEFDDEDSQMDADPPF
jgi:mitotic spindle assembly checkpoint protein MAD2B